MSSSLLHPYLAKASGIEGGSLQQEASYVGIDVSNYRPLPPDPSIHFAHKLFVSRQHPTWLLQANFLNDTWHMSINTNYRE